MPSTFRLRKWVMRGQRSFALSAVSYRKVGLSQVLHVSPSGSRVLGRMAYHKNLYQPAASALTTSPCGAQLMALSTHCCMLIGSFERANALLQCFNAHLQWHRFAAVWRNQDGSRKLRLLAEFHTCAGLQASCRYAPVSTFDGVYERQRRMPYAMPDPSRYRARIPARPLTVKLPRCCCALLMRAGNNHIHMCDRKRCCIRNISQP